MCCRVDLVCLSARCAFSIFFFFKQKTAYEMRISDWSSDVCSSDLQEIYRQVKLLAQAPGVTGVSFACGFCPADFPGAGASLVAYATSQIGRASCRERVCQYV